MQLVLSSCDKFIIDQNFIIKDLDSIKINPIKGIEFVKNDNIIIYGCSFEENYYRHVPTLYTKSTPILSVKLDGTSDNSYLPKLYNIANFSNIIFHGNKYIILYDSINEGSTSYSTYLSSFNPQGERLKTYIKFADYLDINQNADRIIFGNCAAIDSAGGIIVSNNDPNSKYILIRIDTNGMIDDRFTKIRNNFSKYDEIYSIVMQNNNKVLLGGRFNSLNGIRCPKNICRLNTDGNIDTTFLYKNSGFDSSYCIYDICLADSTIYVGGSFLTFNGSNVLKNLVRLDNKGNIHKDFNFQQRGFDYKDKEPDFEKSYVMKIKQFNDSLLLIGGLFNQFNNHECPNNLVIISKNGNLKKDYNFGLNAASSVINIQTRNSDTVYVSGNKLVNLESKNILSLVRFIRTDNPLLLFKSLNIIYKSIVLAVILGIVLIIIVLIKKGRQLI